jgi:hypothetical protein
MGSRMTGVHRSPMQLSVERFPPTLPLLSTANVRVRQFRRKESDAGPAWFFGQTLERRASNHSVRALYLSIVRLKSDP